MKVIKKDFEWAIAQGLITRGQAAALWHGFQERTKDRPRFDLANVSFYAGALIVIAAMAFFLTLAWEDVGGIGIFALSATYIAIFVAAGTYLWHGRSMRVPGGLLVTVAVCMVPLAIYGLQRETGLWLDADPGNYRDVHEWIRGGWFLMEVGIIVAALTALYFFPFPFLTAPIAFSLWYMSMDIVPLIFGEGYSWDERIDVTILFGLMMLLVAYLIDHMTKEDYSFWGYLFGLIAFWGGISARGSGGTGEFGQFLYFVLNIVLIILSVFLERRAFAVFGAIGAMAYMGHLAYDVFEDSLMFPIALSLLGVAILGFGIFYQRHAQSLSRSIARSLPRDFRWLRPQERRVGY